MGMFDDLNELHGPADNYAEIRKNAHVVNGGEATFSCPACKGNGKFISYSGRVVGPCFKCKGAGKVGKAVAAAAKGKATREANIRAFNEEHRAEREYMNRKAEGGFQLMANLLNKWNEYGTLRAEDIERVRGFMKQDAERTAQKKIEREQAAPSVDLSAIEKLFQTATDNKIKRPIFRTVDFDISKAPATGRNAGALYVKAHDAEGTYLGKLQNGKFYATGAAPRDTGEKLMAVAVDPLAESIKYARKTGNCGCCGRGLVDPISILAGIGPICAEKYGLDYRREMARDEYDEMKAAEAK